MPRYFTLPQAESYLPEVDRLLRASIEAKRGFDEAEAEMSALMKRIAMVGGMAVSPERAAEPKRRKAVAAAVLRATFERFEQIGCQLKDLNTGLLDFPTLYHGREVYLCWKLGEAGIAYWHHIEDGFRGRKRIDAEFLQNHATN